MTKIEAAGRLDNEVPRQRAEARLLIEPDAGLCAVAVRQGAMFPRTEVAKPLLEIVRAEIASGGGGGAPALAAALRRANTWLRSRGQIDMFACVAAALFRRGHVHIAHVGNLRVYRWRRGALEQLTRDHTLPAEQAEALIQAMNIPGGADPEMVKSLGGCLTKVLGQGDVEPSIASHALEPRDRFVLCSMDACGTVADADLAAALAEHSDAARVCDRFVELARERGVATDEGMRPAVNVAIIVVDRAE
jgi:serine/threonine protein phosphatase PrpC